MQPSEATRTGELRRKDLSLPYFQLASIFACRIMADYMRFAKAARGSSAILWTKYNAISAYSPRQCNMKMAGEWWRLPRGWLTASALTICQHSIC